MGLELNYLFLDRLIHRIAFAAPSIQLTATDVESALFRSVFEGVRSGRPIFVTSLPRAGTTLLLEALHQFPSLATHLYRDMPFVMAPVLWSRLTGSFRKQADLRERAHGDGMQVGYDSPEAFEEMLWRTFWPEKYGANRIALWHANERAAALCPRRGLTDRAQPDESPVIHTATSRARSSTTRQTPRST